MVDGPSTDFPSPLVGEGAGGEGPLPARRDLGRPELVARLREWILRHGPMTFDRFMDVALYEPGLGYYAATVRDAAEPSSALADYQTSPQVHPAFGHLIARYLARAWEELGRPDPFVIVELGAGAGELARHVREGLAVEKNAPLVEYHAVDVRYTDVPAAEGHGSDDGQPRYSARAGGATAQDAPEPRLTYWWSRLTELGDAGVRAHCVLSNELFDALPVHRVVWTGGRLREIYVDWSERGFIERLGDPSDPAVASWIEEAGVIPPDGWCGEVCLRLVPFVETIAGLVDRGIVLSIDYGYDTSELYQTIRPGGTLVAYHRHHWNDDLYRRVGDQDLTSHVDLGALTRAGRRFGLDPILLTTQRDFLRGLGLMDDADRWLEREPTPARRWQARFALAELIRTDGLGRLKVLVQQRGL